MIAWHHGVVALGGSGEICWNTARVSIVFNERRDLLK